MPSPQRFQFRYCGHLCSLFWWKVWASAFRGRWRWTWGVCWRWQYASWLRGSLWYPQLDLISGKHGPPRSLFLVLGHPEEATSWCFGGLSWWDIIICQSSFSKIIRDSNGCEGPLLAFSQSVHEVWTTVYRVERVEERRTEVFIGNLLVLLQGGKMSNIHPLFSFFPSPTSYSVFETFFAKFLWLHFLLLYWTTPANFFFSQIHIGCCDSLAEKSPITVLEHRIKSRVFT